MKCSRKAESDTQCWQLLASEVKDQGWYSRGIEKTTIQAVRTKFRQHGHHNVRDQGSGRREQRWDKDTSEVGMQLIKLSNSFSIASSVHKSSSNHLKCSSMFYQMINNNVDTNPLLYTHINPPKFSYCVVPHSHSVPGTSPYPLEV